MTTPSTKAYAAIDASTPLQPYDLVRRELGPKDVDISISYCGVCHSDIHQVRNEWGGSLYPMVPGHEIVGTVLRVGSEVSKFKAGDVVGVGCLVDSCQNCASCKDGEEQFCENGFTGTYNSKEQDKKTITYGGYSDQVVVTEGFVVHVPTNLPLHAVAPLLCAGITTYSPLRHWKIGPSHKVGIVGLGGLGHMGVKFAKAFGASTYVITTSPNKKDDALKLGAEGIIVSKNEEELAAHAKSFDFILSTISAPFSFDTYLNLLKRDGDMVLVGAPEKPSPLDSFSLILGRKSVSGSIIGGIRETQEMLDYCGKHGIVSDVEMIPIQEINTAYERMLKSDVKYRFVIDMKSLSNSAQA